MKDILIGIALFIVATLIVCHIDARPKENPTEQQTEQSLGGQGTENVVLTDESDTKVQMLSPMTGY